MIGEWGMGNGESVIGNQEWVIDIAFLCRLRYKILIAPSPPSQGGKPQSPPWEGGFRGLTHVPHIIEKRYNRGIFLVNHYP
jgi:hypothetical protein